MALSHIANDGLNSNLTLWQQKMQIEARTYCHSLMRSNQKRILRKSAEDMSAIWVAFCRMGVGNDDLGAASRKRAFRVLAL